MAQTFDDASVLLIKLVLLAIVGFVVTTVAVFVWRMTATVEAGGGWDQPIAFSHRHHVGDDGIDCRYCHSTVDKSASAGMPATQVCLTCHAVLFRDSPALAPLHASLLSGTPIVWKRVHDLPDFVYFDHSVHVAKGVACVTCHGRVDAMPRIWRKQALEMQWCVECHRAPARHVGPRDQVFAMREPPALSEEDIKLMQRMFNFESESRLTSCTTCHR
jgi:hypothetical protein